MKIPYTYTVLRYVHDVLSGEFINVGVVLYAPDVKFCNARFSVKYSRLSKIFTDVDGDHFRRNIRFIQERLEEEGQRFLHEFQFEKPAGSVKDFSAKVLPIDDTSLQFSPEGFGVTDNLQNTLDQLFSRFVEKYQEKVERHSRTDDDVWKIFKKTFEEKNIIKHLKPHRIIGNNYEYEFRHCWKNEKWQAQQPVSFDLLDSDDIVDKANTWVGRITSLTDGGESFKLFVLLGEPQDKKLVSIFSKAQNILHKMPCEHDFIKEQEAEYFAEHLKKEIEAHTA